MNAKEMFEQLGYEQKIYTEEEDSYSNGIQYIKAAPKSELERISMITTHYIEFYFHHKEIAIYTTYEHRNGTKSRSDVGILQLAAFNAVQKQIEELGWNNPS